MGITYDYIISVYELIIDGYVLFYMGTNNSHCG